MEIHFKKYSNWWQYSSELWYPKTPYTTTTKIKRISPLCGRIGRGFWSGFQGQQRTCWNRGRSLQGSVWVLPLGRWCGYRCHDQAAAQWWMSCFQVRWSLCRDSSASLKTKLQSVTNLSNAGFDWMWLWCPFLTEAKWKYETFWYLQRGQATQIFLTPALLVLRLLMTLCIKMHSNLPSLCVVVHLSYFRSIIFI